MEALALAGLRCPNCQKRLEEMSWHEEGAGKCQTCLTDFTCVRFPALQAKAERVVPHAVKVEAGATCFFHDENEAADTCAQCGRYLCAICAIDLGEGVTCASCIASKRKVSADAVESRILYDRIVLGLAFFPLLMWPFTVVTAPAALGLGIVGWKKPQSLVATSRVRMVCAMVLATVQIVAWVTFLGMAWFN